MSLQSQCLVDGIQLRILRTKCFHEVHPSPTRPNEKYNDEFPREHRICEPNYIPNPCSVCSFPITSSYQSLISPGVKNIKIFTSLTSVFAATKTITATPSLLVIYTTRTVTNVITLMQSTATTTLTMQTTEYTILSTTLPASTISSIDTSTLVISTSTNSYAACFTPNLLGPILPSSFPEAGNHITNVVFSQIGSQSVGTLAFDNAYDCCVACVTTDGCAYGAWSVDVDTFPQQEHKCFGLFIDGNGLCGKQSEQAGYFVSEPGQEGGYKMVVFNACGYVWDGGLDMN